MDYTAEQYYQLKEAVQDSFESGEINILEVDGGIIRVLNDVISYIYETTADRIKTNFKELIEKNHDLENGPLYDILGLILYSDNLDVLPLHINDGFQPIVQWRIKVLSSFEQADPNNPAV